MREQMSMIYQLPVKNFAAPGTPAFIKTGTLSKGVSSGNTFVQLLIQNISDKNIASISAAVSLKDAAGRVMGQVVYEYNVEAAPFAVVGSDILIDLENNLGNFSHLAPLTASFDAWITEVWFEDGVCWNYLSDDAAMAAPVNNSFSADNAFPQAAQSVMPAGFPAAGAAPAPNQALNNQAPNNPVLSQMPNPAPNQVPSQKTKSSAGLYLGVGITIAVIVIILMAVILPHTPASLVRRADKALDEGQYYKAMELIQELGDYGEEDERLKYKFIQKNYYRGNADTYRYLKELKNAGWGNTAAMFDELYAWYAEDIAVNDSEGDVRTNIYACDATTKVYLHITVKGGEPGEKIIFHYGLQWPGEPMETGDFSSRYGDGDSIWVSTSNTDPELVPPGNLYLYIYDDDWNILAERQVWIYGY